MSIRHAENNLVLFWKYFVQNVGLNSKLERAWKKYCLIEQQSRWARWPQVWKETVINPMQRHLHYMLKDFFVLQSKSLRDSNIQTVFLRCHKERVKLMLMNLSQFSVPRMLTWFCLSAWKNVRLSVQGWPLWWMEGSNVLDHCSTLRAGKEQMHCLTHSVE